MNKPFNYKPSFGHLVWFSAFKAVYQGEVDESSADYRYYSEREYFVKTDLSFGQKVNLKMFKALFVFLIKIGLV